MNIATKLEEFKQNEEELRKLAKKLFVRKKYGHIEGCTHLFMHEKCLTEIPKSKIPNRIMYAYYYNNYITKIENLDTLYYLTHLHLEWNNITKIEGLEKLQKLKKLYLSNNKISVVENLDTLKYLEELHIEKQNKDSPYGLRFDPKTMRAIGASLKILKVSGNKLTDIAWIKHLRQLEVLFAKNNKLEDYESVADDLCTLVTLVDVNFTGNPMTKKHRYKETIIASCPQIHVLDKKIIQSTYKTFPQSFDKPISSRHMYPRNKLEMSCESTGNFSELSMLPGKRTPSTISELTNHNQKQRTSPVNSTYTLSPRPFWPTRPMPIHRNEATPPAEPPFMINKKREPLLNTTGQPIKGILKKPLKNSQINKL